MLDRSAFIKPIAHRGLHDRTRGIVENTASAFAAAIAGNYAIECDLQLTTDGEAMVIHDDQLERLTFASGAVKDQTATQMKALTIRDSADRLQKLLVHRCSAFVQTHPSLHQFYSFRSFFCS